MAYEILAIKLCELEDQMSRLSSRIHLSETASHDQLRQEIRALTRECAETDLTLQNKMQMSRTEIMTILADTYAKVEEILIKARHALKEQTAGAADSDIAAEGKILLAEYGLDFALQAANQALLLAMEAIDAQRTQMDQERRPS